MPHAALSFQRMAEVEVEASLVYLLRWLLVEVRRLEVSALALVTTVVLDRSTQEALLLLKMEELGPEEAVEAIGEGPRAAILVAMRAAAVVEAVILVTLH